MASYEKLTLVMLGLVLVWHNIRAGYTIQALSLLLTMRAVLKESSAECVLLLMPFVLLGERCLNATLALGHSPLPFYAAALFSYIASFPSSGEWPVYNWGAFGMGSAGLLAALTGRPQLAVGVFAQFVVGGLVIVACNQKNSDNKSNGKVTSFGKTNRREVLLVASMAAALMLDVFANSNVGADIAQDEPAAAAAATSSSSIASQLTLAQITSFTHIAGRSSLVCAIVVVLATAMLAPLAQRLLRKASPVVGSNERPVALLRSAVFLALCVCSIVGTGVYVSWLMEENALLWLWAYLHSRKLRLYALLLWVTGIPLAVLAFHLFASSSKTSAVPQTVFRKLYHGLAVAAFLPVALLDPSFLAFSISAATALVVLLECARYLELRGTRWVTRFVEHQVDERDSGIVRTHVYLIFGLGLSIFFRHRSELVMSRPTPYPLMLACDLIPGLIGLGVVDAMAAVMGTRAARRHAVNMRSSKDKRDHTSPPTTLGSVLCGRWFEGLQNPAMQRKTVVGCFWGFTCGSILWTLILAGLFGHVVLVSRWLWIGIASIGAATWWEGVCNGIDNLELPLFVYAVVTAAGTFGLR
jgi:dolichol kinase